MRKLAEMPAIEPLPDTMTWFRGRLIDTAIPLSFELDGEAITGNFIDVRDQYAESLRQSDLRWQEQHGFVAPQAAPSVQTIEKQMRRTERIKQVRTVAQSALELASAPLESASSRVQSFVGAVASNVATEAKVLTFDILNGTNLRTELHRQRRIRRITNFAGELGILDVEPCAKHRKAMKKAENLL